MAKVVLHVGPSKTASTTVQKFLSTFDGDSPLEYPKWGWTRPDAGHHNLAYELRNDRRYDPSLGGLDRLSEDLKQGKSLFFSSEDFPTYAPFLTRVKDICDKFDAELEIIFFVRDPIARLNSMYTQQIKTFVENCTFADFVSRAAKEDKINIRRNVKYPLEKAGIKVRFMPFVGAKLNVIFAEMCKDYGFDAQPESFEHTNPAPSPEEIALYRQIGHRMKKSEISHWGASAKFSAKYGYNRKYFGFDPWMIQDVRTQLEAQYDDLAELGVETYRDELNATFFKAKPKCANIEDQDIFQEFKRDMIEFMKL